MKVLGLLFVLLLAVLLLPRRGPQRPARSQPRPHRSVPVRVVRSPRAAHEPKTVRKLGGVS